MGRLRSRVYGVGINDAGYVVQPTVNSERVVCPFYRVWKSMLARCYSDKDHTRRPTYIGCSVCEDWLTFSIFKEWMVKQVWEGKQLDKDLLITGNKTYSPEACVFVPHLVNSFTLDRAKDRGEFLIGCCWDKPTKKFMAYCNNPFTKKREYLGLFAIELEAHLAWKTRKHELACQLAESEYVTDERVAAALRVRYSGRQLQ
jgi:hypothetical protein